MLKWMTDSDTNLTIVCRHRWSRKMTMKVDKYLKLSARTAVFIATTTKICTGGGSRQARAQTLPRSPLFPFR